MGTLLCAVLVALSLVSSGADAAPGKGGQKRGSGGKLTIKISGLPRGEQGTVVLLGPRQSSRDRGKFHRVITKLGKVRLKGLKPGRYQLRVLPVVIKRRHGTIKRGATAYPARRSFRVKVRRRSSARATARYNTIRNPGLRIVAPRRVIKVLGKRRSPRALVLRGAGYRRGMVLSSKPSARLPRGLLARVKRVESGRFRSIVQLRPASIYEVAPNMSFRTRLHVSDAAAASAGITCEGGSGISPFVRISDVWVDGGWTTSRVWPFGDIKTGARVDLAFDVGAGVDVASVLGGSCQLTLPGFSLQGFAAGIPIYGAVKPVLTGTAAAGVRVKAEGTVRVNMGARVSALPPQAAPSLGFGSPRFTFSDEVFSDVGLGFGLKTEVGLGVNDAANIHASFGNNLDFRIGGGACRWDLRLGTFSAGGKLGRFGISTPSTPPLLEKNLWQTPCGPPPLTAPLLRAQAEWNTDADVDLYAWDEAGNEAYFANREAIPGAELVEDVIPGEAEIVHDPELFKENQFLGRRLTFGLCLFSGVPSDVTLKVPYVPDPRGPLGVYPVHLAHEGHGVVVATSPIGPGFTPPPDWCRSVASD
ncbi:MAG: hypothetical protein M3Y75_11800 [Actinomycetota bacterium]|nr:hypothetical protein [Actinomycetota bacterium]